jgi:carbohydrate-binding DOMON domain-containing protein
MKQKKLVALALASALTLGMASAQAVEFTDPKGDDNGPGNYTYPTDGVYKPGSFDLTKLKVTKTGDQVDFSVDVNSSLEDPWGMGVGFAVQEIFIFIKNKDGGYTDVPPGLNVEFAKGHEWNKLVILSPQKKGRVLGEASTKAAKFGADIVVPNSTKGSNRTIKGSVMLSEMGGDGNVDAWSYQAVMQSNEGFPEPDSLLARKVNEYEGQHRWGGGHDGNCDPHVIDVLEGTGATQKDQLAYECGPNGESVKKATLKVFKGK